MYSSFNQWKEKKERGIERSENEEGRSTVQGENVFKVSPLYNGPKLPKAQELFIAVLADTDFALQGITLKRLREYGIKYCNINLRNRTSKTEEKPPYSRLGAGGAPVAGGAHLLPAWRGDTLKLLKYSRGKCHKPRENDARELRKNFE